MRMWRVAAVVLALPVLAAGCAGQGRAEREARTMKLACLERFPIDTYPVGCWLWGDIHPGGGAYTDAELEQVHRNGFNMFIGSADDLPKLGRHGLKIMFGDCKQHLPQVMKDYEKYGKDPNVVGFHLNDNCDLHDYTVEVADWLLKTDRSKLAWMSSNPNPVAQSRVPMPIVTSQIYPFSERAGFSEEQKRTWFTSGLDRDRTHSNRYNMAMWPVVAAYASCETPSEYKFQVNAAAAYGAQGVWLFAYNRYFRPILGRASGPANRYLTDVAGPYILGRRSVAVFHTGPEVPGHADVPGKGKLIESMDELMLAGVLVPDKAFQAGIDAPDGIMIVDKRTKKFAKTGEFGKRPPEWEPQPEWMKMLLDEMYADDPAPRVCKIQLSDRVTAAEALLADGTVRKYKVTPGVPIELPPLRGGEGLMLRITAKRVKLAIPDVRVWTVPNLWKFSMDDKQAAQKEKWFSPGFDDSAWKQIYTDKYCGWKYQGYWTAKGDGWYRLRLTVPAEFRGKHVYLHFGAADEQAWVYVDGKLALEHSCASTRLGLGEIWTRPFFFDCPALADGKEHTLAVCVNNSYGAGGLYEPIYLVSSSEELDRERLWRITQEHQLREKAAQAEQKPAEQKEKAVENK